MTGESQEVNEAQELTEGQQDELDKAIERALIIGRGEDPDRPGKAKAPRNRRETRADKRNRAKMRGAKLYTQADMDRARTGAIKRAITEIWREKAESQAATAALVELLKSTLALTEGYKAGALFRERELEMEVMRLGKLINSLLRLDHSMTLRGIFERLLRERERPRTISDDARIRAGEFLEWLKGEGF